MKPTALDSSTRGSIVRRVLFLRAQGYRQCCGGTRRSSADALALQSPQLKSLPPYAFDARIDLVAASMRSEGAGDIEVVKRSRRVSFQQLNPSPLVVGSVVDDSSSGDSELRHGRGVGLDESIQQRLSLLPIVAIDKADDADVLLEPVTLSERLLGNTEQECKQENRSGHSTQVLSCTHGVSFLSWQKPPGKAPYHSSFMYRHKRRHGNMRILPLSSFSCNDLGRFRTSVASPDGSRMDLNEAYCVGIARKR